MSTRPLSSTFLSAWLLATSLATPPVAAQTAATQDGPVTVTLLRWPYT